MHGIPISNVAPRGRVCEAAPLLVGSVIVSDDDLRFSVPLTVEVLSCFSCDFAFESVLLSFSTTGDVLLVVPLGFRAAGVRGVVGTFLEAMDVVEFVERIDIFEGDRLATGDNLVGSRGGTAGRLSLGEGIVLAALEAGREGAFDEVDWMLTVDTEDAAETRRVLGDSVGCGSDLAVSNAVEPSLVAEDSVEGARVTLEGARTEETGTGRRRVDVVERVDRTDAALDFGLGVLCSLGRTELVVAVVLRLLATLAVVGALRGGRASMEKVEERGEDGLLWPFGVNLESGRTPEPMRLPVVVVLTREAVEWVLRATERTDAAEDLTGSFAPLVFLFRTVALNECILAVSLSSAL